MKTPRFLQTAAAASLVVFATAAFSIPAQANEFYQVTNVQVDDSLNIRAGAGTQNPVIGTIPPNGRTILTTGNTEQVGSSTWVEVVWLGQIGWVNSRFLSQGPVSSAPAAQDNSQADINYQQQAPAVSNNSHTHPANRCTRSITHAHPGAGNHQHNYSCQRSQTQPKQPVNYQQQAPAPVVDNNAHTHPANRCTRTITHSHPNGAGDHSHNYNCQRNQVQNNTQGGHTHPANRCTNSITHTHPNGSGAHNHRYACQPQQVSQPKYNSRPKYSY